MTGSANTSAPIAAFLAASIEAGRHAARLAFDEACRISASPEDRDTLFTAYASEAYGWIADNASAFGIFAPSIISKAQLDASCACTREMNRLRGIRDDYEPPDGEQTTALRQAAQAYGLAAGRAAFQQECALPDGVDEGTRLQPLQQATDAVFAWVQQALEPDDLADEAAVSWWNVEVFNALSAEYIRLRDAWAESGGRA